MHYPCLARCPIPWKRRSQLSRSATILGNLRFFHLGALDEPSFLRRRSDTHRSQLRKFLLFVALACSVRITSAITWAFLFPPLLWQLCRNRMLLRAFITDTIITAYVFERPLYSRIHTCHNLGVWHVACSSHLTARTTAFRHSLCSPFSASTPRPSRFSMAQHLGIIILLRPFRY